MRAPILTRLRPAIVAALVAVWVFPHFIMDVGSGLDPSWGMGLHQAWHRGMRFGHDIVYTFGPLGFLVQPVIAYPAQGLAAGWLRLPLFMSVAWFALRRAERAVPWWAAAIAAVPLTWAMVAPQGFGGDAPGVLLVIAIAIGVSRLLRVDLTALGRPTVAALAASCTICALIKVDVGLVGAAALLLYIVCEGLALDLLASVIARRVALATGALVISACVLWPLLGQRIGDLPPWLSLNLQVVLGFNASMGADYGRTWWFAACVAIMLCTIVLIALEARALMWRRRTTMVLFTAPMLVLTLKQAFLRVDGGHVQRLLAFLLALVLVLASRRNLLVVSALSIALVLMVVSVNDYSGAPFANPLQGVRSVRYLAEMTTSSSRRAALVAWGHTAQPTVMKVPPTMIARIGRRTVHIEPWDASVAWVYGLNWKPLPVFQTYVAYTERLDRLNAEALAGGDAPQTILHQSLALDGRIPRFQSPTANLEMLCRYRVTEVGSDWNLFERDATDRCGPARPLGAVDARRGTPVTVPTTGADVFVIARFDGLEPGAVGAVRALVLRPRPMLFRVGADPVAHRFLVATQHDAHIVRVPQCLQGRLGSYDTSSYDTFTLSTSRDATPSTGPGYRVRFETVAYRCP